jgi:hypothetical protein
MSNRAFILFALVVLALGACTGYRLSAQQKLEVYKLLNVVGLCYDLLAVVVLSEIVGLSTKWKKTSVETLAPMVLWFHTVFPLGVALGGLVASVLMHRPSGRAVSAFAFAFWVYSIIPLSFLDAMVAFPRIPTLKPLDTRWRVFAVYLGLTGVTLQLVAAIVGLLLS